MFPPKACLPAGRRISLGLTIRSGDKINSKTIDIKIPAEFGRDFCYKNLNLVNISFFSFLGYHIFICSIFAISIFIPNIPGPRLKTWILRIWINGRK